MSMSMHESPGDAPVHRAAIGALALESGEAIEDCVVSWVEHGLQAPDAPVALVLCAIGSTHRRMDFLIGPGLPLDTCRLRIIAVDALGNGLSSSPSSSARQPGHAFPRFGIRDMVQSQKRLLDTLGVERLALVAGASMGGMQALQWGVSHPERMERIVALSPLARTPGWTAAVNEAARRALAPMVAPEAWPSASRSAEAWQHWLLTMQLLALRTPARVGAEIEGAAALRGWLARSAEAWVAQAPDPLDWIYQSWAYDAHDVGATPGYGGDTAAALGAIRARTLVLGASLDLYNPGECAQWAARQIPDCSYVEIASAWGHLAFSASDLDSAPSVRQHLSQFLWTSEEQIKT